MLFRPFPTSFLQFQRGTCWNSLGRWKQYSGRKIIAHRNEKFGTVSAARLVREIRWMWVRNHTELNISCQNQARKLHTAARDLTAKLRFSETAQQKRTVLFGVNEHKQEKYFKDFKQILLFKGTSEIWLLGMIDSAPFETFSTVYLSKQVLRKS